MTQVNLKYRRIDGVNLDGALITTGTVTVTPIARRDTSAGQMTTADLVVNLAAVPPTVQLAGGTYRMRVRGPGVDFTEHRLVPSSGGPFDVDDLDEVTPTGDVPLAPEWKAYIDAAIAGVLVGATTPEGIIGSTAIGQALIVAADQAAGRTAIDAAPGSHTHTLPSHNHEAGDITSGTMSAARLPAATATAQGAVELATPAEALAGTDAARAVTPQGLAGAIAAAEVANPSWEQITDAPGRIIYPHDCPGDVLLPRPIPPAGLEYVVQWRKATRPLVGGVYAQHGDTWVPVDV